LSRERPFVLPSFLVVGACDGCRDRRNPVAHTAESDACRDIRLRYEAIKPQISAIEVSLTLFSAVDKNCIDVATGLLDSGASVDARDRFGARP